MPIFEKPPLETLTPAKDRWTPIYLEYVVHSTTPYASWWSSNNCDTERAVEVQM